jgi:predicted phage terminase large subunit-like protein
MTRMEAHSRYDDALDRGKARGCRQSVVRHLAKAEIFFLLVYVLHRVDVDNDWCFDRCMEYDAAPDGHLDLWFREGYKSTIGSFGGIIQGLANDPERTYCIFSFVRPIAKAFLRQIKIEIEANHSLVELFPEVFWENPKRDAPMWSEDGGLILKRKGNPKEASLEAYGLVDGQPTSRHFTDLHYEDIVTVDTVRTPEMIEKTTNAFRNSLALGAQGGRRRAYGTTWHYADTYRTIVDEGILKPRIWAATKDGTFEGEPWLWTREELKQKISDMGPHIAAAQLFLNPRMDSLQVMQEEWLRYWRADRYTGLNLYILCDPASEKKKGSDYTVFIVIGLGSDRNYYVVNWIRDRLSLTEKANVLFKWHQQYQPVGVGYEKYGMQSDIAHFQDRMERDNYRFSITPLAGTMGKGSRIERLVPLFSQGRLYLPQTCPYVQYDGETVDITRQFVNDEYLAHPFEVHDDTLDCLARITDEGLSAMFPQGEALDPLNLRNEPEQEYDPLRWGT